MPENEQANQTATEEQAQNDAASTPEQPSDNNNQQAADTTQKSDSDNEFTDAANPENPDILAQQLKTSDPERAIEIEREILRLANIKGLTLSKKHSGITGRKIEYSGTIEDFLRYNSITFRDECEKYGGSADKNPFIAFLKMYANKNSGVDAFLKDGQRWNTLHNLVANGTVDEKQLSFKAPEADQLSLLLNPTLWEQPASDIKYIVDTYVWLKEASNLPNFLINKYIIFACVPNIAVKDNKPAITPDSYKDSKVRDTIIKAVLFADLNKVVNAVKDSWAKFTPTGDTQEEKDQSAQNEIAGYKKNILDSATGNVYIVSSKINDADMIENNINLFNQAVQESSRGIDGRYQQTDTLAATNNQNNTRNDDVIDKFKAAVSKKINNKNMDAINAEIEKMTKELNK